MKRVRPKKFLGQHFLKDLSIASRIADTIDDYTTIPIVEVGPGMGVLTQFLLEKGVPLTVVELDRESVPYLREHFPQLENNIIEADFLKLDLSVLFPDKFCVTGNYPYNISSQILFKVLDYKEQVLCCTGMFQKEVGERITAKPGTKSYGILSVLLQAWYNTEYLFTVDETVFNPPPKVKSAVVRITRNDRTELDCDQVLFKTVVKTAFNQRRKTLRNSLRSLIDKDAEIFSLPVFSLRPERLSVSEFEELTNLVSKHLPKSNV